MARYYFPLWSGARYLVDEEGLDLSSAADAYLQAFRACQDQWIESVNSRGDPRRCRYDVADVNGDVLFQLPFVEVLNRRPESPFTKLPVLEHAERSSALVLEVRDQVSRAWHTLRDSRRLLDRLNEVSK